MRVFRVRYGCVMTWLIQRIEQCVGATSRCSAMTRMPASHARCRLIPASGRRAGANGAAGGRAPDTCVGQLAQMGRQRRRRVEQHDPSQMPLRRRARADATAVPQKRTRAAPVRAGKTLRNACSAACSAMRCRAARSRVPAHARRASCSARHRPPTGTPPARSGVATTRICPISSGASLLSSTTSPLSAARMRSNISEPVRAGSEAMAKFIASLCSLSMDRQAQWRHSCGECLNQRNSIVCSSHMPGVSPQGAFRNPALRHIPSISHSLHWRGQAY